MFRCKVIFLFAIHNPHSYPKRFSGDVSVFVETHLATSRPDRNTKGAGVLAFLFFVLFTLTSFAARPLLLNQSRKSLAINHFPPSLLSASTLVTSPCLPPLLLLVTFPFKSLLHNLPD